MQNKDIVPRQLKYKTNIFNSIKKCVAKTIRRLHFPFCFDDFQNVLLLFYSVMKRYLFIDDQINSIISVY